jgi:hypothetical protein
MAKARKIAEAAKPFPAPLGADFKDQWQRIRDLIASFAKERGKVPGDEASSLAEVLRGALSGLEMSILHGNLDFAQGSPVLTYHVQRAKTGNYASARWLRDNISAADRNKRPVSLYVRLLVDTWRQAEGGLRRAIQKKGQRGKRGAGRGLYHQLHLAREVWKRRELAGNKGDKLDFAIDKVAANFHVPHNTARDAYYDFQRGACARTLYYELARDFADNPVGWRSLARTDGRLLAALQSLQKLRPGKKD